MAAFFYFIYVVERKYHNFIEKLESQHVWPSLYMFKFIVPREKQSEIEKLFPRHQVKRKSSSRGNYISLTIKVMISESEEVVKIYEEAHKVEGVIAL